MDDMAKAIWRKLSSRIVASSIWREPTHVKVVWITMIALSDQDGVVHGSVGGLADLARVSRQQCQEALDILSSPDPDDSSEVNDGIRLERVKGGWRIVNFQEYQDLEKAAARKESQRQWMRDKRARDRSESLSTVDMLTTEDKTRQDKIDLKTDASHPCIAPKRATRPRQPSTPGFDAAWKAYPHHAARSRKVKAVNVWKSRGLEDIAPSVMAWISAAKLSADWREGGGRFVPGMQVWLAGHDFTDPPPEDGTTGGRHGTAVSQKGDGPCANDVPSPCGHEKSEHIRHRSGALECRQCQCSWYTPPKSP